MASRLQAIAARRAFPLETTAYAPPGALAGTVTAVWVILFALVVLALTLGQLLPRQQLAFVSNRDGNPEIYLLDTERVIPYNLTRSRAAEIHPAWSPDGRWLAFLSNRDSARLTIHVMKADGSGRRQLSTYGVARDYPLAWSPDSRQIAFVSASIIYAVEVETGALRRLTDDRSDNAHPAWSPDGQQIAFISMRDGNSEIYVMRADGSDARRLTFNIYPDFNPIWSVDGSQIAFLSVQNGASSEIYIINPDGSHLRRLTRNYADDRQPMWSPDGSRLAFVSWFGSSAEIVTINADGGDLRLLTRNSAPDFNPAWSPDGQWIALRSIEGGTGEIYVIEAGCARCRPRRLTDHPANDWSPVWRP